VLEELPTIHSEHKSIYQALNDCIALLAIVEERKDSDIPTVRSYGRIRSPRWQAITDTAANRKVRVRKFV
jgi:hypothetical protein